MFDFYYLSDVKAYVGIFRSSFHLIFFSLFPISDYIALQKLQKEIAKIAKLVISA